MATIRVEIADTPSKHETGLMGRKRIGRNAGMLFDFGHSKPLSFWMKDTYIPLQIAFIDAGGKIGQIENMDPLSRKSVRSNASYRYALEVNRGWFDRNGIQVGAQVAIPFPPPGQMPGSMSPGQPGQGQPQQAPQGPPPNLVIEFSVKEILRQCVKTPVPINLDYTDDDGNNYFIQMDGSSYRFVEDADNDPEGRFQGWGVTPTSSDGKSGGPGYKTPLVDGINGVFDMKGNPIKSPDQVKSLFRAEPLPKDDAFSAAGKMGIPAEQPTKDAEGQNANVQS